MSFDELLKDLEELQSLKKSAPVDDLSDDEDDDKIAAAADDDEDNEAQEDGAGDDDESAADDDTEAPVSGDDDEDDEDEDDEDEDEDDDGDVSFGKSFSIKTADGQVVEAVDGMSLIKSLTRRIETQEDKFSGALSQMVDLIKSQHEQITAMRKTINRLAGSGRGRKAVLSVVEKPDSTMAKSQNAGMSAEEFMAKALEAQRQGRVTSVDIAMAETALMKGMPVPESVVQKVLS